MQKKKKKNRKREKKVIESLGALFLPQLGRTFPLIKRNMRVLRRSPRGVRED